MSEKLHIRLHVYDMDIAVNINREDEELYRNAAKLITGTVNDYAKIYKENKTVKDLLYMALIDIALRYMRESKRNDTAPISNILVKITSEIENALKE
ncbi:MAG: cell division protein ZapA [Prevotella sp.]|uniref:cell division protein ZapA n=1 Tax=Prevotella sp. Rep29 TaxID=2691580 RepID=UPI001C6E43F9|nr:cell division protein ZapA [Prevotella sp. Rep29]MBR3388916.1 cell division protein ZapA [Prevotella sp.]MBR7013258.1 cell division protein ZapA [Prevotella sp.]MBR7093934.1 cell division protein ZapA [Prevotella sp.]QYR10336.1 cell division protein ZapA [Prevotella sp. Rep29]